MKPNWNPLGNYSFIQSHVKRRVPVFAPNPYNGDQNFVTLNTTLHAAANFDKDLSPRQRKRQPAKPDECPNTDRLLVAMFEYRNFNNRMSLVTQVTIV